VRGRFFPDLALEKRFRALNFVRQFLHEFLGYAYDFFTKRKLRKYIMKSKSFLHPRFRSFLEYLVIIFGICELNKNRFLKYKIDFSSQNEFSSNFQQKFHFLRNVMRWCNTVGVRIKWIEFVQTR